MTALLASLAALAAPEVADEKEPQERARKTPRAEKDPDQLVWSGIVLPLFGANSQDGPGFGLGGEIFARRRAREEGYRIKFTGLFWITTDFGYTSDYVQVDYRSKTHWIGRLGYRGWRNHAYVGAGGADVQLLPKDAEIGNRVTGPFGFLGASRGVGGPWKAFAQAYYKTYFVRPGDDAILRDDRPYGVDGATYLDFTVGLELDTTDRWPMPRNGVRAEISGRAGVTFPKHDEVGFLAGSYAEIIAWKSLGKHLTFAGRVTGDQTAGKRPFFEQDIAGGRWRDELGSDQMFAGYGRTRTRGDGFFAAMVEVRPYFFKTNHKFLDFAFHASAFAEAAWLTEAGEAGPILPTVGFGPQVVFQGAIQCRPYAAWGWRSEEPGDPRKPVPQFGISFLDPL